jgi:hypothetical protein
MRRQGIRFLNPTKEQDYGVCIFEDPVTHELIGTTPAARYHIDVLDLNSNTFVFERKKRAEYQGLLKAPLAVKSSAGEAAEAIRMLSDLFDLSIPPIPPPPPSTAL